MASNPFDQFATELNAAMPGAPPAAQPGADIYGAPPPTGQAPPPFGAPPPQQQQPAAPPQQPDFAAPGNPYGAPPPPAAGNPYGMPPPPAAPAGNPYGAPPPMPQQQPQQPPAFAMEQPPPAAPVAAADPFSQFGAPAAPEQPPVEQPPVADANPFGAPVEQPPAVQPTQPPAAPSFDSSAVPPPQQAADPWGAPAPDANPYGAPPPQGMPPAGAGNPYGAPPPAAPGALVPAEVQNNPYAAYGAPPPPQQANPYGAPPPPQQANPYGAPPPAAPVDPFSVFNATPVAPPVEQPQPSQAIVPAGQQPPAAPAPAAADEDFWGAFSATAPAAAAEAPTEEKKTNVGAGSEDLPPGGEWYDARIFTPTLGVMFFKPQELTDSLFLNTDKGIVDALNERPVVAFIVEGSSARSAGVELGHVLLKVNGVDVKNPKEASRLIKEGPRPLPLLFYVPNAEVVVAEGEHMVKYDTRETTAPNSAKDWKPKYVVIGGIIAQPWMMNMYRSKSEYDIAVIETQARRPVSVKVKQFSLQGARIQNDWQGPQMVKYKNKLHPWKYIVVLPVARNPIKISSPNLASLKPVHEGIRRVLLAQQRDRGNPSSSKQSSAPAPPQQQPQYAQQQQQQPGAPPQYNY